MTPDDPYHRGARDRQVDEHERRLNSINGNLDRIEVQLGEITSALTKVTVKVAIAASLGAIVATPVAAVVVYAITS